MVLMLAGEGNSADGRWQAVVARVRIGPLRGPGSRDRRRRAPRRAFPWTNRTTNQVPTMRRSTRQARTSRSRFSAVSRALAVPALLLSLVSCATEPITGRWVFLGAVGEDQINAMGVEAYDQILAEAKPSADASQNALVERVGRRIAGVVDQRIQEEGRQPYEWQFVVIDEPTVNAFALPGGKVAFYAGILPICADEAGVAVVMGHEVAHAYAQHGRKRVNESVIAQAGLEAVNIALSSGENEQLAGLTMAALGVGAQVSQLAFSRGDESSADHIGLFLMADAGYDPRPAVEFWKRMAAASEGAAPPEFLSTHPSHDTRVEQLEERMPEALERWRAATGAAGVAAVAP